MNAAPEQIQKLPKWAQSWIEQCERRCNEAETRLKDYLDNQSLYIQDDLVVFQLTKGDITFALRDDAIECHASYRGGDRLIVRPHVTNVVWLEIHATP